jgi:DNA-binding PadR family transcriptional regulator
MSVKHALLASLAKGPMHGYGLKSEFEARLGQGWPLNIGQVYTTLARLERDGLVEPDPTEAVEPQRGGEERRSWRISEAGRAALAEWYASPVARDGLTRDELLVKLTTALDAGIDTVVEVIRAQRTATLELLQRHTRAKADAARRGDLPRLLATDLLIAQAEAEAAWLDLCEARTTSGERRPAPPAARTSEREEVPR